MQRDWKKELNNFEKFLENIDVKKYSYLRKIKTVEQDLPNKLLPLEIFYRYYWNNPDFKDYDEIFHLYWSEKLKDIFEFIKKYFYGCSLQFVEEGFKARLYRIWMSILTQFHFQYLWNANFLEKVISTPELDKMGIDSIVEKNNVKIALQIKKISYRREVSDRRFTKRQQKQADIIIEIPYLVIDVDELKNKINSPKTRDFTKEKCKNAIIVFEKNFKRLENGFVIFKKNYLQKIYNHINKITLMEKKPVKIPYSELLQW